MVDFWLMRHGDADYGLAETRRLKGGCRDWVPLSPFGAAQAEQAGENLAGYPIVQIVSSPMTRALQTASIANRKLNLPLTVEFDLHEWLPDLAFEYDSVDTVLSSYNEMLASGGEWPVSGSYSWEPLSSVRRRVRAVLKKYREGGEVLVVCHGAVIQSLTGVEIGTAQFLRVSERDVLGD